ncbi:MAG: hypothetical protein WA814_12610 [Candidatus Baltobacteraceae bacterium]
MTISSIGLRKLSVAAIASVALAFVAIPGHAQMRQQLVDKMAVNAAHSFVTQIGGESCTQFASTMEQMKQSKSGASPSPMSAKLKGNTQARSDFVNIVAGPLLNKMIDCNMMPGGM